MKQIVVIVTQEGETLIDAVGFKGADCTKATKFLEQALGKVEKSVKKPEFNQHEREGLKQS